MPTKIITVPFSEIFLEKSFNARKDYDDISQLAASIKSQGLLEPIGVVEEDSEETTRYRIIYGARRFLAISSLREADPTSFVTLQVVLTEGDATQLALLNLTENVERNLLKPHEIAKRIQELTASGLDQRDIAARLGRPQSWVSYYHKLGTKLGDTAWQALADGRLTVEQALNIADVPTGEQRELVQKIISAENRTKARQIARAAAANANVRRIYSNKGRPTTKSLISAVEEVSFDGSDTALSADKAAFFNGIAAGLRLAIGTLEYPDLDPDTSYLDVAFGKTIAAPAAESAEAVAAADSIVTTK